MKREPYVRAELPLSAQMRALADKKPAFADELRDKAKVFEDAGYDFFQCNGEHASRVEHLTTVWTAARKVLLEASQPQPGEVASHQ